jgi:hypothetical protein
MSTRSTIRVRIAVAIDSGGEWNAHGWGGQDRPYEPDAMSLAKESVGADAVEYWLEAELPLPGPLTENEARVLDADVRTSS